MRRETQEVKSSLNKKIRKEEQAVKPDDEMERENAGRGGRVSALSKSIGRRGGMRKNLLLEK